MVFTSTKRPPDQVGGDPYVLPAVERRRLVRVVPTVPLADHAVADVRLRKRSTSCVVPCCSSVSRFTTVTAWGSLMASASMAVPVTETVTSSKPADGQLDADRGDETGGQLHAALGPLAAGPGKRDDVAAVGAVSRTRVEAVAVGHRHPRASGKRRARRLNGHARRRHRRSPCPRFRFPAPPTPTAPRERLPPPMQSSSKLQQLASSGPCRDGFPLRATCNSRSPQDAGGRASRLFGSVVQFT